MHDVKKKKKMVRNTTKNLPAIVRHTLKLLQHLLQDFLSVSDHFETLRI